MMLAAIATLREGLILMALPLGILLVVGVVVGLGQAVTQIQDATVSLAPKLVALGVVLWMFGPWMFGLLRAFTIQLWTQGS